MTQDRIDRLYGLPLDRFTAERNALALDLKAKGDTAGSAAVKALVKPSASAWAANQAVRANPEAVQAAIAAGDDLRRAQQALLAGGDASGMQAAMASERAALMPLVRAGSEALAGAGMAVTSARTEELTDTFHALAVDAAARTTIASGRLTNVVRAVGFGEPMEGSPGDAGARRTGVTAKPADDDRERVRRIAEARSEAERLGAAAEAAEREAAARKEGAEVADREAERARALALESRKASARARHEAEAAAAALARLERGR